MCNIFVDSAESINSAVTVLAFVTFFILSSFLRKFAALLLARGFVILI